jgi:hypothetical protein
VSCYCVGGLGDISKLQRKRVSFEGGTNNNKNGFGSPGGACREHSSVQQEARNVPRLCFSLYRTVRGVGRHLDFVFTRGNGIRSWNAGAGRDHDPADACLPLLSLVRSYLCVFDVQSGTLVKVK